ncbi:MAG: hypothetical protein ACI3WR_06360 [Oscillospiraceae bacterium]
METRSDLIFKWSCYSALTLAVLALQALLLPRLQLFGVGLFLPPVLAAILSAFEPGAQGMLFAAVFGLLCDFALLGPFPCFYLVTFLLISIASGLISTRLLNAGLLCSAAVTAAAFLLSDAVRALFLIARHGAGLADVLLYGAKELLLALPFVVPLHFLFAAFHRRFHFYD